MQEKNPAQVRPHPGMRPENQIDLLEMVSLLIAHWWKIALCTLLGALLVLGYSNYTYVPTYRATAKLYLRNNHVSIGITQVSVNAADLGTSRALVSVYSEFLNSHMVMDAVGDALADQGYPGYNYYNLSGRVSARAAGDTQMMYISASDHDPEAAITIVNTLVEVLPNLAENVIEGSSVMAIDPAYTASILPSPVRQNTLNGALLGLALSSALVLLYYYLLNDLVQQQEWFTATYPGIPQLGCVPDTLSVNQSAYGYQKEKTRKEKKANRHSSAGIGEDLSFFGTEAYNTIRTNIKFSFHGKHTTGHVIGITSSMVGDGKSYTSVNLAYAMAKDNLKVLLIDGDMRKLTLNDFFQVKPKSGLSEILCSQSETEDAIQKALLHENLDVLFSGEMPPNPSELLGSPSMKQLLEKLRESYDYVLIDLPPLGSVIDAAAVSEYLDGMILIVRHDHTRKKHVRSSVRQLELSGVHVLGYVYNANVERYSLYGNYYKKYYRSYTKEKR